MHRILQPLRIARAQAPALREVYQLMTEIWAAAAELPADDALAELLDGARLFPRDPQLLSNVALLHARAGRLAQAEALLVEGLRFTAAGSETKTRVQQMLASVRELIRRENAAKASP